MNATAHIGQGRNAEQSFVVGIVSVMRAAQPGACGKWRRTVFAGVRRCAYYGLNWAIAQLKLSRIGFLVI